MYSIASATSSQDSELCDRPLAAAACYETEIKFLPIATGVLHIECLRLVDLNTQEAIDIRDLPDIVASERDPR